jgi:hypothetical protein
VNVKRNWLQRRRTWPRLTDEVELAMRAAYNKLERTQQMLQVDCVAVTITAPSTADAQIKWDAFIPYVSGLLSDFLSSRSLLIHSRM